MRKLVFVYQNGQVVSRGHNFSWRSVPPRQL